ncbi:DUF1772 domain-containing protein [Microvirga soli]|uniref:DUF1772 domain-containing protein n=1 Tax=Microvirga soli TaxID=1854496 RepID=UPI00191DA05C|nr:DUF1772 domain-containing protein [Microvirga soli]
MRLFFYIAAACGTAAFTGAMLTIGLVLGAYWESLPPAEFIEWFAENSYLIGRVIPLFVIPALIGLIGGSFCDRRSPQLKFWLASLGCMIGILIITIVFHLPTNAAFNTRSIPLGDVGSMLDQWLWLHAVRIALGLAASILSVVAISGGAKQIATDPKRALAI